MKNKSAFETVAHKDLLDISVLKNNSFLNHNHKITNKDSMQPINHLNENTGKSDEISIQKSGKWTPEEVKVSKIRMIYFLSLSKSLVKKIGKLFQKMFLEETLFNVYIVGPKFYSQDLLRDLGQSKKIGNFYLGLKEKVQINGPAVQNSSKEDQENNVEKDGIIHLTLM